MMTSAASSSPLPLFYLLASPLLTFHFPPSLLFFIFYYFLFFLSLCNLFSLPLFLYSSVCSLSTSTNFLFVSTLLFLLPFHPSVLLFPASSHSVSSLFFSSFISSFVCLLLVSYFLISVPSTFPSSPLSHPLSPLTVFPPSSSLIPCHLSISLLLSDFLFPLSSAVVYTIPSSPLFLFSLSSHCFLSFTPLSSLSLSL